MRRRQMLAGLAAMTILGPLSGCSEEGARARAQRLADEVMPGQLTVLSAQVGPGGPVPSAQIVANYRINDDPDAEVQLVGLSADGLRAAVETARRQTAELRSLEAPLAEQGLELVGLSNRTDLGGDQRIGTILVEAAVTEATLTEVLRSLDVALGRWYEERPGKPIESLSLSLIARGHAAQAPAPASDLPRTMKLSYPPRVAALERFCTQRSYVEPAVGGLTPVAANLVPALSDEDAERLAAAVSAVVPAWLRSQGRSFALAEYYMLWSFYLPGSLTQLRTYQLACPAGRDASCNAIMLEAVVAMTVDLETWAIDDLVLVTPEQRRGSRVVLPIEPDRQPR